MAHFSIIIKKSKISVKFIPKMNSMNKAHSEGIDIMVATTIQEKNWNNFQLLSVELPSLLRLIGQDALPAQIKIED